MSGGAEIAWLAVDWGTTHMRLWAMDAKDQVVAARRTDQGMGQLAPADYGPALQSAIAGLDVAPGTLALCCGAAGARQGWTEAGYRAVPCAPLGSEGVVRFQASDLNIAILPGLSQARPADVLRGEEVQIAGYLATDPHFDGVICLPGTHSKWAHISAGEVVSFRSFMTGELYALLSRHSLLRHSVAETGWDEAAFAEALSEAMTRPADGFGTLFELRARDLLHGLAGHTARALLSGRLIGMELAAARPYWLGRDIVLIGAAEISQIYGTALTAQGCAPRFADADATVQRGLGLARTILEGPSA